MPPSHGSQGKHGSAKEFESSNSTTAKFLGAVPKAWMDTHSWLVKRPIQLKPGSTQPRAPQASGASRPTAPTQSFLPGAQQPVLSSNTSREMEAYPKTQSVAPRHQSSSKEKTLEVENVLPSPASSDEHRHGSVCITEVEKESAPSSELENRLEVDPLRALTDEFGGVEEIERLLRASEVQQRPTAHSSPASRPNLTQTTGIVRPEKRASEEQSERPRKMISRQGSHLSPMVATVPKQSQTDSILEHLTHLLEQSSLARNPPPRHRNVTSSRLRLLQDALKASDYLYLVLHQIYCLYSKSPRTVLESYEGFEQRHLDGLNLLTHLLIDNSALAITAVDWFSTFPFPADLMLRNHAIFRTAYTKVLEFLERFNQQWARLKDESRKRSCPPSANEMIFGLGLDSTVLQSVLYRAIHRDIWKGNQDHCLQQSEKIFLRTQQEAYENGRPKSTLLKYENEIFVIQVRKLWMHHNTHCLAAEAPAGHIGHPQQQQSGQLRSTVSRASGRQLDSAFRRTGLSINAQAAQRHSSTPWTVYRPSVPSSPPLLSPISRINPAAAQQANSSPGLNSGYNSTLLISSQSTGAAPVPMSNRRPSWTLRAPQSNQPLQSRMTHVTNREGPQDLSFLRNSSAASPARQQDSNMMLDASAGPQSILPHSISRGQADQLMRSYVNYVPGSSSASTLISAQSPVPQPVRTGPSPAGVHTRCSSPYPPPSPASLAQGAGPFVRPVDQFAQAATATSAVHQAHLRSPILEAAILESKAATCVKYFTYIREVRLAPDALRARKRYLKWTWAESKEAFESLATCTQTQHGAPARMQIHNGSHVVRLRCVKTNEIHSESDWVAAENSWPEGMAIIMNGKGLDVRRKLHYSKDLPANITTCIKEGENVLTIAISQLSQGDNTTYTFGLESIHMTNTATVKSEVKTLIWLEARDRILKRSGLADPDVQVLDPTITLDLTDPHSSFMCHTPARGSACRHNQCFDFDIFLSTRSGKTPAEPCEPDQFRCPICGADARPKNLVIDGFFLAIREALEQLQRLDVKAVVLDEKGKWSIKEAEGTGEACDGTGKQTSKAMSVDPRAGPNSKTNEVIELDDGDRNCFS